MSTSRMKAVTCDVCENGNLKAYQLNFEEAIFLCTNEECVGHLNKPDVDNFIVKRKLTDIDCELEPPKKKNCAEKEISAEIENASVDDLLDHVLSQHDVLDLNFDISDILDCSESCRLDTNCDIGDIFGSADNTPPQQASKNFASSENPTPQNGNEHFAESRDLTSTSSNAEVSIVEPPSRKTRSQSTMKITLPTKKPTSNGDTGDKLTVAEKSKNVKTATTESSKKCDFLEACLCLLQHSQQMSKIKLGKRSVFKKLQDFYSKAKCMKGNSNKAANGIRSEFMGLLHRKGSTWDPSQSLPIYALPELVKNGTLRELFWCTYRWEISCTECHKKTSAVEENAFLMLDKIDEDFSMTKACCSASCTSCGSPNQRKTFLHYILPKVVAVHFTSGVPLTDITALDFVHHTSAYKVTQVIQQTDENQFFTWNRNTHEGSWTRHESIGGQPVLCGVASLELKAPEYHLVVWEKQEDAQSPQLPVANKVPQRCLTTARSLPNSPHPNACELMKPKPPNLCKNIEKCDTQSILSEWPRFPGNRHNAKDTTIVPAIRNHDIDVDNSVASPSSSEISNSSDGDVTVANSLFRAPIKHGRTVQRSADPIPWQEENLDAHQKKWTEWMFHEQKQQRKKPTRARRSRGGIQSKEATPASAAKANKLLSGFDIFLK